MVEEIKAYATSKGHLYATKEEAEEMEELALFEPIYLANPPPEDANLKMDVVSMYTWLKSLPNVYFQVLGTKEERNK